MASQKELIAAQKSIPEIAAHVGADSLAYISLAGMMIALGATGAAPEESGYCNACFTGEYPFSTHIPMIELEAKHKFAGVWGD